MRRQSIPGIIAEPIFSTTRFSAHDPAGHKRHKGVLITPDSFNIIDGFRQWAAQIGMSKAVCERHILASRGRGIEALYAGLQVVKNAYQKKDREYI